MDGHLDAFFTFAFNHTGHGDGRHPQYCFSLGERQLEVFENFNDDGMQFDNPAKLNVNVQNLPLL